MLLTFLSMTLDWGLKAASLWYLWVSDLWLALVWQERDTISSVLVLSCYQKRLNYFQKLARGVLGGEQVGFRSKGFPSGSCTFCIFTSCSPSKFLYPEILPSCDLLCHLTPSSDLDKRNTCVIHAKFLRLAGCLEQCAVFPTTDKGNPQNFKSLRAMKNHRRLPRYIWNFCFIDLY